MPIVIRQHTFINEKKPFYWEETTCHEWQARDYLSGRSWRDSQRSQMLWMLRAHLLVLVKKETTLTKEFNEFRDLFHPAMNPIPKYVLRCYLGSSLEYEGIVVVLNNWYPKGIRNTFHAVIMDKNSDKKSWGNRPNFALQTSRHKRQMGTEHSSSAYEMSCKKILPVLACTEK